MGGLSEAPWAIRARARASVAIKHLRQFPWALAAVYFLNAWAQTFPLIANNTWLSEVVKMKLDTLSNYYAIIMLPWSMKPIFALILENVPILGMYRRPYLVMTALTAGGLMVARLGISGEGAAFAISFVWSAALAFNEIICGAVLMDVVDNHPQDAGAIQAIAQSSRTAGSLAAALCNLLVYPCSSHSHELSWKTVYIITGLGTAVAALFAPFFPEPTCAERPREHLQLGKRLLRICWALTPIEALCVWLSLKPLVSHWTWWVLFWCLVGFLVIAEAALAFTMRQSSITSTHNLPVDCSDDEDGTAEARVNDGVSVPLLAENTDKQESSYEKLQSSIVVVKENWRAVSTCVFLVLMASTPSSSVQMGMLNYDLFRKCDLVYLSLHGFGLSLFAALAYSLIGNRKNVRWGFPIVQAFVTAAALLSIPVANITIPSMKEKEAGHCGTVDFLGADVDALKYVFIISTVQGLCGMPARILKDVLATEQTPRGSRLLYYAVFLSFLDIGASIREWVTAPLVKAFHVTFADYSGMTKIIIIAGAIQLVISTLSIVIIKDRDSEGDEEEEDTISPLNTDVLLTESAVASPVSRGDDPRAE
eukprot:Rhum_TRINITY_DN21078_c0_g1::Rhum_TRINITY_DN21078_c0_g1_i1::g.173139::m.173139